MLTALLLAIALVSPCHPTTSHHERWTVKTRPAPATVPTSPLLHVADVLAWPVPYAADWRADEGALLPREDEIRTVRAVVREAKISPDDCDIHLEVADSGASAAPRMIVEIPASEPEVRQALARLIGPIHKSPHHYDGAAAPPLLLTGWVFLDVSHQLAHQSQAGHAHGSAHVKTLYELHPVFRVAPGS